MSQTTKPKPPSREDIELAAWLTDHGVPLSAFYGIDAATGKTEAVLYACHRIDLAKLRDGLDELIAPYQEHIAADHAALKAAWERHQPGRARASKFCADDGFPMPCPTRQAITGDLDDEPPARPGRGNRKEHDHGV